MTTRAEENYVKAIFKLAERGADAVSTNAISQEMQTTAASVTDMIKRLSDKGLVHYEKYRGAALSDEGKVLATSLVRKHRLWEVFLANNLGFGWDRVHDMAEELEHIGSEELVNRLDAYLGHPRFDPHGDPIPNSEGKFTLRNQLPLSELPAGKAGLIVAVREHSSEFLAHLNDLGIAIDKRVEVIEHYAYDDSMQIRVNGTSHVVSSKVGNNIYVKPEING
jgi:DtxR family Mn-dependent transcriptional regulator